MLGSKPVFWAQVASMTMLLLEWLRGQAEEGVWRECVGLAQDDGVPFAALFLRLGNRPEIPIRGGGKEIGLEELFKEAEKVEG